MRRSKADAEQTKIAILDAAELLFRELGAKATPMERIACQAGVTRGAIYWHFKNKEEILHSLRERSMMPQEQLLKEASQCGHADPLGLLAIAGREVLELFESDPHRQNLFIIMNDHTGMSEASDWLEQINEEVLAMIRGVVERAQEDGSLGRDWTPQDAAIVLVAAMNGILADWLRMGRSFSLSDLGGRMLRMQLDALRAKPHT